MATADKQAKSAVDETQALTPREAERLRQDFPALHVKQNGKTLIYLDNAATSQKPAAVIERLDRYYRSENANVHRGMHHLSEVATAAYEDARKKVQRFLGIPLSCEVVFTRGTTEGINLVAQTFAGKMWARMMRSSSARWSTTPTSCPGRCSAMRRARNSASSR